MKHHENGSEETVTYRLYFGIASRGIFGLYHCSDLTHYFVFYARSDEAAREICRTHIDSNDLTVSPTDGLYRVEDDREHAPVRWRETSGDFAYFEDRTPQPTHDPETELRQLFSLAEIPEFSRKPVTKVVAVTEPKKTKRRPRSGWFS